MKPLTRDEVLRKARQKESLKGANLYGIYLWGANLQGLNLEGADLRRTKLWGANLEGAKLGGARLDDANLERANLKKADLEGAILNNAHMQGAILEDSNLKNSIMACVFLEASKMSHAQLNNANLANASLEEADLTGADLRGADLKGANLVRSMLERCILKGANLEGANLEGANLELADMTEAYLVWANFMIANMKETIFVAANLEEATLWGANLEGANLEKAELRKADLDETNLKNTIFINANLQYAHLNKCNLNGADLSGAKIYGASLRDIKTKGTIVKGLDCSPKGDGSQTTDSVKSLTDFAPPIEVSVYLKKVMSESNLIGLSHFLIKAQESGNFQVSLRSLENNGNKSAITFYLQNHDNLFFFIFLLLYRFHFSERKHFSQLYEQLHNSADLGLINLGRMRKLNMEEFFSEVDDWEALNADSEVIMWKKNDLKSIEIINESSPSVRLTYDAPHLDLVVNQDEDEFSPMSSLQGMDYQYFDK